MTTRVAGSVVLSNLAYVAGALVVIVVITTVMVLRQRKPKSMEANVESFNRGLRALAPGSESPRRGAVPADTTPRPPQPSRSATSVRPVRSVRVTGRQPAEVDPG